MIVLIALLALSIFTPEIMAKQGNTQPVLASLSNLTKNMTQTKADSDTAIFGVTSSMKNFLDGTFGGSSANYKDIMDNNNAARWDILYFLSPDYAPSTVDVYPSTTPVFKKHEMS